MAFDGTYLDGWAATTGGNVFRPTVSAYYRNSLYKSIIVSGSSTIARRMPHERFFGFSIDISGVLPGPGSFEHSRDDLILRIGETEETLRWRGEWPGRLTVERLAALAEERRRPPKSRYYGLTYIDALTSGVSLFVVVGALYQDYLGRDPDDSEVSAYVEQVKAGNIKLDELRKEIVNSKEFSLYRSQRAHSTPGSFFSRPFVWSATGITPRRASEEQVERIIRGDLEGLD